jgi:hypothetical protein
MLNWLIRHARRVVDGHHRALGSWYPCGGDFILRMRPDGTIRGVCERCRRISPGWGEPERTPRRIHDGPLSFVEIAEAQRVLRRDPAVLPEWYARRRQRPGRAKEVGA